MENYNCLDQNLNLWGHHFLEASAGTGKTFTIEHIVLRLLLEKDPIDIDQILIVTFTRAATRELKQRIQNRLREGLRALEQGEIKYPYLDLCEKDKAYAIERLNLALSCFDKAQIYTIHSFCHRTLLEEGFEAGVSLDLSNPDDLGTFAFRESQIKDFLRTGIKPELFAPSQIERVLQACGGKIQRLIARISQLDDEAQPIALPVQETLKQFNLALNMLPEKAECVFDELCLITGQFKGVCDRSGAFISSIELQIKLLAEIIESQKITLDQMDVLLGSSPNLILQLNLDNRKKRDFEKVLPLYHAWILANIYPLIDEAINPDHILRHMGVLCKKRLEVAKEVHGVIFPDDLLQQMHCALENPLVAEKIRQKYKAAIVDEFQDTDSIQWSIFQKLFMFPSSEIPAFYLVGDPKQSIYAFRKADLYTYLKAQEKLGLQSRKMLNTNYRSSKELIDGLNTLFAHEKAGSWLQLPSKEACIHYQPVLSSQETEPLGDDKKAVHILKIDDPKARSVPSKDLEERILFPYIASEIKALGLGFSSFAILIKDRYQSMRLQKYFKRIGIPAITQSGISVCASKVYLFLNALLEAVIRPSNLGAIKKLLSAPIVAWNYLDLLPENHGQRIVDISSELHKFKEIWETQGFAAFINAAQAYSFGHDMNLIQLLAVEKENYVDFTHLIELLLEEEGKRPHSMRDLHQVFKRFKQINPDHHPHMRQRKVFDESAVTIMTTHMSKGLEFDVVFALGMGCRHSGLADLELEAEKLRLFYVALTRAKRRVYLPVISTSGKPSLPFCASPAEKFFEGFEDLEELTSSSISVEELNETIQSPSFTCIEKPQLAPPKAHGLHFARRSISSYSGLVTSEFDFNAPRQSKDFTEFNLHTLPAGADTGVLLHHLLEKTIEMGLYRDSEITRIQKFVQNQLKCSSLRQWDVVIAKIIFGIMQTPIDGFSLKDVPENAITQEMEFLLPMDTDLMIKGFVDLIFQYENKTYIIDWKSNWLGESADDYTAKNLSNAMEHHEYTLQARIYGAALVKWLQKYESRPASSFYGGAYYVFLRGIENEETHGIYHYRNI